MEEMTTLISAELVQALTPVILKIKGSDSPVLYQI